MAIPGRWPLPLILSASIILLVSSLSSTRRLPGAFHSSSSSCTFPARRTVSPTSLSRFGSGRPAETRLFHSERIGEADRSSDRSSSDHNQEARAVASSSSPSLLPQKEAVLSASGGIGPWPNNWETEGRVGQAAARLGSPVPTVWTEFSRLAQEYQQQHPDGPPLVNLGQGFPDWLPPRFAMESLVEAALLDGDGTDASSSSHVHHHMAPLHQYTRTQGHPGLVQELAHRYSKHLRRDLDPFSQVAVTVGASQALYLSLQTLIGPGDQVILFEPFFDLYVNQVKLAGGTPVYVPLRYVAYPSTTPAAADDKKDHVLQGGEWVLDLETLKQAVTLKTKAIILNSPHNPTGKIFTRREMEYIAEALEMASPDCVVLSDEVYKYIVHAPPTERAPEESLFCRGHVHFASLPGMWDRTITISSAGKTFSATGWQIGWCIGPAHLISRIHQLLPYVQFCPSTVMQEALARSLPKADAPFLGHPSYYDFLRSDYTRKRDLLAAALTEAGFAVPDYRQIPGGGFFIFAKIGRRIRELIPPERLGAPHPAAPGGLARPDWALCQWLVEEWGLLCIPASPFFSADSAQNGDADEFVRIAFCKTDETIAAATRILRALHQKSLETDAAVAPEMQVVRLREDGPIET